MADTMPFFAWADGSAFASYPGQLIATHENTPQGFQRVWYDGTNLQTTLPTFTAGSVLAEPWYQDVFAPIGFGTVPPPVLEPGLPQWTVYLDSNGNGKLDPGEPSTVTDVSGNYAFYNLAPGSYTVAEVQQTGWTQTGPVPVPPGTYSESLASGQTISGLDFGNQQNPLSIVPIVPTPLTPPSDNADPPPVFTSTAPTNATATVGVLWSYPASATDPDGGVPLTFDLPVHPAGMVGKDKGTKGSG
jgi:hypothetical protein